MAVPAVLIALGKQAAVTAASNAATNRGKGNNNGNSWIKWVVGITVVALVAATFSMSSVLVGLAQLISPTISDDVCVIFPDEKGDNPPDELDPDYKGAFPSENDDTATLDVNVEDLPIDDGEYVFPMKEKSFSLGQTYNLTSSPVRDGLELIALTNSPEDVLAVAGGTVSGISNKTNTIAILTRKDATSYITIIYQGLLDSPRAKVGDKVESGTSIGQTGLNIENNRHSVYVRIHDQEVPLGAGSTTTVNPQTWFKQNNADVLGTPLSSAFINAATIYGDDWLNADTATVCEVNKNGGNTVSGSDNWSGSYPSGGVSNGGWGGHRNGMIPASAMSNPRTAPSHHRLRTDAAQAFDQMSEAYRQHFGSYISVTDSYRSYPAQVRVKAAKGWLAATPGTSNHGWGLAVDLGGGINRFGTPQHQWMRANAPRYGWVLPGWAQQGGSKPEAWHWEYAGSS